MRIILDGEKILKKKDFYACLDEALDLPEYFGNNLDALADILSESGEQITVECQNYDALTDHLGSRFVLQFKRMLTDIGAELINHYDDHSQA